MKERYARIVERIVLSALSNLPAPLDRLVGDAFETGILFVYDSDTDQLAKGKWSDGHRGTAEKRGMKIKNWERTTRGIWYEEKKMMVLYSQYLNGSFVDPPYSDIDRVGSLMRIKPEKIYRFRM